MTDDTNLDEEIDSLALEIERQISDNKEKMDELPEFDPKYRRMEEAQAAQNAVELFS